MNGAIMSLDTVFYLSVYGLSAWAGLTLAIAEGAVWPTGLTVPAAVAALVLVERRRSIHLPVRWANILGLLAAIVSVAEFVGGDIEARLLSGAHFLVYVNLVVLFLRKLYWQYWWICALSVLQMAVASVLTSSPLFGLMLLAYLTGAIWTLSVFSLYVARQRTERSRRLAEPTRGRQVGLPSGGREGDASDRYAAFVRPRRRSRAIGSIQRDPGEQWVTPRFAMTVLTTVALSLVVGAAFFLFIPRFWLGGSLAIASGDTAAAHVTGFSDQVRLGEIGRILESDARVFAMRLFDARGEELNVERFARERYGCEEPYFRGKALEAYAAGRWMSRPTEPTELFPGLARFGATVRELPGRRPSHLQFVIQHFDLQPIATNVLFALVPARWSGMYVQGARVDFGDRPPNDRSVIRIDVESKTLIRPGEIPQDEALSYEVYGPLSAEFPRGGSRGLWRYRLLPPGELERLRRLALEVVVADGSDLADVPPLQRAERLLHYLRDSQQFGYTLDASIEDPTIDPVEDFLFNRKRGHCEYFASALALMLRAVDVPTRLITGFKGGELNALTGEYTVEQRFAHAWVEAFLDGHWVLLDPTPAVARNQSVRAAGEGLSLWKNVKYLLQAGWSRNVLEVNIYQQRTKLYQPLYRWARDVLRSVTEHTASAEGFSRLIRKLRDPREWFSVAGFLAVFVLAAVAGTLFWLVRRVWSELAGRTAARRWGPRRGPVVAFYERFLAVVQRHGCHKTASQTPLEFAAAVAERFAPVLESVGLRGFPCELAELFYRVRFGATALPPETVRALEGRLKQFEHALQAGGGFASDATSRRRR